MNIICNKLLSQRSIPLLGFRPSYNFTIVGSQFDAQTEHVNKLALDLANKKYRKMALDQAVLRKEKVVVPAEFRTEKDSLVSLKKQLRSPVYIKGHSDIPDVDLIADNRQVFSIRRRLQFQNQSFYFKVGNEEFRCTYDHIQIHPMEKWLVYSKYRRYVVGKPNSIYLPINILPTFQNNAIVRGSEIVQLLDGIWVNSYNDEYPHSIVIDPENLSKIRPLRIGDIHNFLPDGVEIDKTKCLSLHQKVIKITGDKERKLDIALQNMKLMKEQVTVEEEEDFTLASEVKKAPKERKNVKVRSLKKQVQAISAQVKEKLAQQQASS
ncbi:hypothetical protein ABPG74_006348 [Tetrahymena malaccensis]